MIAVRAFTVKTLEFALAALEFVQEPDELVRYCHWYLSPLPVAVTEIVVCVPFGAEKFAGCFVITGFETVEELTVSVTMLLYT